MKQLPVKDLACLSYSRRIHEGVPFIQSVQANLHMNYFLEIPASLDKLKDLLNICIKY